MGPYDGNVSRLMLGTAAFGPYAGHPALSRPEATALIEAALSHGIRAFDTAPAYGSEGLLGEILDGEDVFIATKVTDEGGPSKMRISIERSRRWLRRTTLDVVQLHVQTRLAQDYGLDVLFDYEDEGVINRVGVSVYSPEDAVKAVELGATFIQAPYNLLDRRVLVYHKAIVNRAPHKGLEVLLCARSIWLRGAIAPVWDVLNVPYHVRDIVKDVQDSLWVDDADLPSVALRFVLPAPFAYILIGPRNVQELEAAIEAARKGPLPFWRRWLANRIPYQPENVVDPRKWPRP